MWIFTIAGNGLSGSWEEVKVEGPTPAPRAHHSWTKVDNRIFIFGGYGGAAKVR